MAYGLIKYHKGSDETAPSGNPNDYLVEWDKASVLWRRVDTSWKNLAVVRGSQLATRDNKNHRLSSIVYNTDAFGRKAYFAVNGHCFNFQSRDGNLEVWTSRPNISSLASTALPRKAATFVKVSKTCVQWQLEDWVATTCSTTETSDASLIHDSFATAYLVYRSFVFRPWPGERNAWAVLSKTDSRYKVDIAEMLESGRKALSPVVSTSLPTSPASPTLSSARKNGYTKPSSPSSRTYRRTSNSGVADTSYLYASNYDGGHHHHHSSGGGHHHHSGGYDGGSSSWGGGDGGGGSSGGGDGGGGGGGC